MMFGVYHVAFHYIMMIVQFNLQDFLDEAG